MIHQLLRLFVAIISKTFSARLRRNVISDKVRVGSIPNRLPPNLIVRFIGETHYIASLA
jgi:hypothetical protein